MAIEIIDKSKCSGCSACFSVCPKRCIVMREDKEGFLYPSIDDKNCIHCGLCERICPIKNRYLPPDNKDIIAIAAQLKDDSLRLNSSSGGVFTAIAEEVIKRGGVVFGAAFNKNLGVRHIYTETKEGLSQIRGSKYLQSIIGDAYKQAEHFLKNGRQVFFTGTPCQIGGLYAYLGENYDNLITQDLVCHGVPSPLVWGKYLTYRKKEAGANVENVFFRDKRVGWKKYSISLKFSNQTEYSETIYNGESKDLFMHVFLKNYCLRPSCYNCAFKTKFRQADITLADFWGLQNILPEVDDDKGTSFVTIHSEKGKKIIESIRERINIYAVRFDEAIKYNSSMVSSVNMPKERAFFMKKIIVEDFKEAYNKTIIINRMINIYRRTRNKLSSIKKRTIKLFK